MILFDHVHGTVGILTDVLLFSFFTYKKIPRMWALVWNILSCQSGFVLELRNCRYVCTASRFGRDGNEWVSGSDGIALGSEMRNGTWLGGALAWEWIR